VYLLGDTPEKQNHRCLKKYRSGSTMGYRQVDVGESESGNYDSAPDAKTADCRARDIEPDAVSLSGGFASIDSDCAQGWGG
jgi:hypothetical protein